MLNIKGGDSDIVIQSFGCSIEQHPNARIMNGSGDWVEKPKHLNTRINNLSSINSNNTPLDDSGILSPTPQQNLLTFKRADFLNLMRKKQPFFVWTGKSTDKWETYETFNPDYCLRQILDDEIVIEFDSDDLEITTRAINDTGLNLIKAGIEFEIWYFENCRSSHIHIRDLPIKNYSEQQRKTFKRLFIRKYVPLEYLSYVDLTLTEAKHMIALEYSQHWKSLLPKDNIKYRNTGIKVLVSKFPEVKP